LRQIQHLYQVEAYLRQHRAGPAMTCRGPGAPKPSHRGTDPESPRPPQGQPPAPAPSLLGQAIDYALGQWPTLEILPERRSRRNRQQPGRKCHSAHGHRQKNWPLHRRRRGRRRSAIIYTVIESCRRREIDPYTYLRDVLTRLPNMTTGRSPK